MTSLLVILPTYNEKENIRILIPQIHSVLNEKIPYTILVIDDNSSDLTNETAKELGKNYPVEVIVRPSKMGLGSAYTLGFDFALKNGFSFALTMDADCSHNPVHLLDLLKFREDNDLIIGSRYVPGGEIENWPLHRNILSSGANFLVKNLLTKTVRDNTSGYRLYSTTALKNISYKLPVEGYAYLFEMAYHFKVQGFRIKEVPIVFVERRSGASKVSRKEIWKALLTLMRLSVLRVKRRKGKK